MDAVYFWSATIGGTILVLQTLLLVFGAAGHDADAGHAAFDTDAADAATNAFFKVLSLKALVAFATFFGLAGLAAGRADFASWTSFLLAFGAGALAFWLVAWLMEGLSRLQSRGNVDLENAIGSVARVYLRIPPRREGQGKVTVAVQGRTVECRAITPGREIPTGAPVRVVSAPETNLLEVTLLEEEG